MNREEAIKLLEEIATSLELSDRGIQAISYAVQVIGEVEDLKRDIENFESYIKELLRIR
jgi:DNA polymerase/3'-5' exonuclease PolX